MFLADRGVFPDALTAERADARLGQPESADAAHKAFTARQESDGDTDATARAPTVRGFEGEAAHGGGAVVGSITMQVGLPSHVAMVVRSKHRMHRMHQRRPSYSTPPPRDAPKSCLSHN